MSEDKYTQYIQYLKSTAHSEIMLGKHSSSDKSTPVRYQLELRLAEKEKDLNLGELRTALIDYWIDNPV